MPVDAANDDISTMLLEEGEHKQFMDNNGVSCGVGPNQIVKENVD